MLLATNRKPIAAGSVPPQASQWIGAANVDSDNPDATVPVRDVVQAADEQSQDASEPSVPLPPPRRFDPAAAKAAAAMLFLIPW